MAGYGSDQAFSEWLASQGLALPVGSPAPAVLRQIGSDYVDAAYEHALQCSRRSGGFDQERAWPRTGHVVNGQLVPNAMIPPAWVNASYRAAYLQAISPGWATGSTDPNRVTRREKVDVIEREFFSSESQSGADSAAGIVADAIINGMLLPWLCSSGRDANSLFRVI